MTFVPGESGNPYGRPPGSRNKRTQQILGEIKKLGHKDPLIALSEIITNSQDESIRATASSMLAPYMHSKSAPKFIEPEVPVDFPPLDSLEHAVESIAKVKGALIEGKLSVEDAQILIATDEAYIRGKNIMEVQELQDRLYTLEQAIASQPTTPTLHVQGGLPPLPGANITMPQLNGNQGPRMLPPSPALGETIEQQQEPEEPTP
jgi:hypothetical protein